MYNIVVRGNQLIFRGKTYHCIIGRGGIAHKEKEGDGITPIGTFPLRECWYRADKMSAPNTGLPLKVISQDDGWCDDPKHPAYNTHVKLPFAASHETLWRDDNMYDLIIPIGYNDSPVVADKGSAIFMHLTKPEGATTEGCVALSAADMLEILPHLGTATTIEIKE